MEVKVGNIFTFFIVVLNVYYVSSQKLRAGGANVCAKTVTVNTYYVKHLTRIGYDNYRTCCGRFLGICTDRCTRYRSKRVGYTKKELRIKSTVQYYCCNGWAPSGDQCTIPICNPRCQNGRCSKPNYCQCKNGFIGRYCETDIDECKSKPCDQICTNLKGTWACGCKPGYVKTDTRYPRDPKCSDVNECTTLKPCKCASTAGGCTAPCQNLPGSYKCSCRFGFQLMFDKKTCVDIDECKQPSVNKCQHRCQNEPGAFRCYCNKGYILHADKRSCTDINECATLNGGCSQVCINKPGTFQCTCRAGYRLDANKRTCIDIDECQESNPCDQTHGICQNLPGSFQCSCKPGYTLQTDKKSCTDLNECSSPSLNACSQKCHNNVGSYSCSCNQGYRLNKNGRSCDDVDECTEKKHNCQHNCHNNVGSFTCSCRAGYKLASDKVSCTGLPCETITKPQNGEMTCSGYITNSQCASRCNPGYSLVGDAKRTCQTTGTWSGKPSTCKRKACPDFPPPQHGSVLLPCVELFGSSCFTKCSKGYHLSGNRTSKCIINNGVTKWAPNNAVCKASTPCLPNPCLHSGVCKEESAQSFTCDCSGTSYTGKTCHIGLISMPSIPQLALKQPSEELTIFARPDEILEIRPIYDQTSLKFTPERITIYPTTAEAKFEITALKLGSFKIEFEVFGLNAATFEKPAPVTVYSYQKVDSQPVGIDTKFMKGNCKDETLKQCGGKIKMMSSCTWSKGTNGFVSIKSEKFNIPLSLAGLNEKTKTNFATTKYINPSSELRGYLSKRNISATCTTPCSGSEYNSNAINFITKNNIFQRAYVKQINALLSSSIQVHIDSKERYFDAYNFLTFIGDDSYVRKTPSCRLLDVNPTDLYSVYIPKSLLQFSFGSSIKSTSNIDETTCFAHNLCKNILSVSLAKSNYLNYANDLTTLGINNVKLTLKGFSYGFTENVCVPFDKNNFCVTTNAYADALASISFLSKKTSLSVDGKIYTTLNQNIGLEGFSKEREMVIKGVVNYKFALSTFGSTLKISGKSIKSEMFIKTGGSGDCPICNQQGAKIVLDNENMRLEYPTSTLRFKPTSNLYINIPFNWNGGKVIKVNQDNVNQLTISIRALNNIVPKKLNELSQAVKTNTKQYAIITKGINNFNAALKDFELGLAKGGFTEARNKLQKLKDSADDLRAQIDGIIDRNSQNVRIKLLTRIILIQIKNIPKLKVVADIERISSSEQGQVISYDGSICLHELCFNNVNVKIYDLLKLDLSKCDMGCRSKMTSSLVDNAVVIELTSLKDQYLSKRIKMDRGMQMQIVVSKEKNELRATFVTNIKFFEDFVPSTIIVSNDKIQVKANDIDMFNKKSFAVKSTHDTRTATWKNIVEKLNGVSYLIGKDMLQSAQTLYSTIASQTDLRLNSSRNRVRTAEENLKKGQVIFNEVNTKYEASKKSLRIEEALYRRYLLQESNNQTSFNAYLKTLDPLFIQKNVEKVVNCKIEKCKETCIPMPVCDTCQDPLILDVPTLKCEPRTEQIRRNIFTPKQQKCPVTQYLFIPVYTGTCKVSPQEQAASDAQLKNSLVTMGSAIGGAIGSIAGPLGSVVGAVIGSLIGGFLSLFSSCDKSYEVVTRSWVEQKNCILMVPDVRTITRPYSECFDFKVKTQTGFKVPYTCNCKVNDCIAKTPEQDCLYRNQQCENKREEFFKRTKTIPDKFKNLYKMLQTCQNNVNASLIKIQNVKKTVQFYQKEYDRTKNRLSALQEELKFAKQSYSDSTDVLFEETCISKSFVTNKDITKLINIKNIQFDITLPVVNNIRLNAQIRFKDKDLLVPFVHDLTSDNEVSLKTFTRKIIMSTLCQSKRKRRSLEIQPETKDLTFKPWYIDPNATASVVKLSCNTLGKTLEFLNHTVKNLNKKSNYANDLLMQLQYSVGKLNPSLQVAFSAYTGPSIASNDVIKANEALLMAANNELNEIQEQVSVTNVLNTWQNEAEIITGFNNVSVCLSYNDCIDNAIDTLSNLPTLFNRPRKIYLQELNILKENFIKLYNETNLIGLSTIAQSIVRSISRIEAMSLHCADLPKVTLVRAKDQNVEVGSNITLICSANSTLPVSYFWEHNDEVLDEELSNTLTFTASKDTQGIYTCIAKSLVGNGTSTQVRITLYNKPSFIEEPGDKTYILPAHDADRLVLTCNATDYPKTTIAWYYRSMSEDTRPYIINKENGPLLVIKNPTKQKSGYYFCQAFNKYGRIKSREARVDILKANLADAEAYVSLELFNNIRQSNKDVFGSLRLEMLAEIKGLQRFLNIIPIKSNNNRQKLILKLAVSARTDNNTSLQGLFNYSTRMRQNMASSMAVLINKLVTNDYRLNLDNGDIAKVDNDTIKYGFKLNICKDGYKLHKNGFMCVQCPYGTAGKNCAKCPLNTYADEPGLNACKKCGSGDLTEKTGAVRKSQCVAKRARKSDIIFVIDTSQQYFCYAKCQQEIRTFISNFVKSFKPTDNIRFALLTYDKKVDIFLTLKEYSGKDDLLPLLDYVTQGLKSKDTTLALSETRKMFIEESSEDRKKVVIVFTNGFSMGDYYGIGFVKTKREAIALQQIGAHMISIGTGRVDFAEIRALASYPKLYNSLFPNSVSGALQQTLNAMDDYLGDFCYVPGIDIGIIYYPPAVLPTNQVKVNMMKIKQVLLPIHNTFSQQSYNFIWSPTTNRKPGFESFNSATFTTQVEDYVKRSLSNYNIYQQIAIAMKVDLTELHRSYAKVKTLIVITPKPLKEDYLKRLQVSYYGEQINLLNVALDASSIEKYEGPFSTKPRTGRLVYGTDESDIIIKILKDRKKKICY